MNCRFCSADAKTVTKWNGNQIDAKPDIYSIWRCEQGHHFHTVSKWEGAAYKTDFIEPQDLPSTPHFY